MHMYFISAWNLCMQANSLVKTNVNMVQNLVYSSYPVINK